MTSRIATLRSMSGRELAHRLKYRAYTAIERRAHRRGAFARVGRLQSELGPEISGRMDWQETLLTRSAARRIFSWEDNPSAIRELFQVRYPQELERSREIAIRVARREVAFFGDTFRFGGEINWHADPVTGAEWPRQYHRDVLALSRSRRFGDVKHVWELNRHQFLTDLAKVAFIDGRAQCGADVEELLHSWLDAAPYGTGVPWACALEPAFRSWSWLWSYRMLLAARILTPAAQLRWLEGFLDHARFLHRHLEYYSSPYNHLIGEASSLFVLGLAFPEFREASDWVRRGRRVLETTLTSQFHRDGGTVEQSTFYHHATLGFYLLSAVVARRCNADLSPEIWRAIERGIEFSIAMVQPDGRLPSIGGADDGKPIRLEHLPFWDFRPYYAIGAVLFRRSDFKAAAGRFWEDALWMLGPAALQEFETLPSEHPVASRTLTDSGYSVFRSSWSADADYVCFDCGPQAAGLRHDDVPSAAHGHADCLSVIATLGGQPVLVDPGFYCYNGEPDWEVFFRKTAAHTTVSIDGRDQARHISKMAWTHTYTAHFEGASLDDSIGWARGTHDGYADRGAGVFHRRTIWLRSGGYLVIYDEIWGRPGPVARANFQFAPGPLALESADCARFADRFELAWTCSVPATAKIYEDGVSPSGGWIAPSLGVRQHAPRLLLEFPVAQSRVVLLTILADRTRGAGPSRRRVVCQPTVTLETDPVLGARIEGAGWEDCVVAARGGRPIQWDRIETDASVAVLRVNRGVAEESRRIGGTYLRVREPDLSGLQERGVAVAHPRSCV